jgi:hypothetical protein
MELSNRLNSSEPKTSRRSLVVDGLWLFRGVAATIAAAAVYFFIGAELITRESDLRNAVNVIAGTGATILGFLVSAGALLYAVSNTALVRNLQRTRHFHRLLEDLFICATAFLVALVVALTCLFLPAVPFGATRFTKLDIGMLALVFSSVVAYLLLIPVGHKMWELLSNVSPEDSRLEE